MRHVTCALIESHVSLPKLHIVRSHFPGLADAVEKVLETDEGEDDIGQVSPISLNQVFSKAYFIL